MQVHLIDKMNENRDTDDTRTCEIVRDFLDEVVDQVVAEFNRIERLQILAQRVLDDIETRAPIRAPGAGDVYNFIDILHNQNDFGNTQHEHNSEGQARTNPEEQVVYENREVPLCRSRSERTQPKCFTGNTIEPSDTKKSVSCKSLPTCSNNQSSHVSINMSSSRTSSQNDTESNETSDDDASSITEEMKYPKYEMVQTVKTSLGDIKIYCNGEIDQAEIDRITMESKKILYTRKLESAGNKVGENKTKGFVSRIGQFLRRLCCCCRSVQDEE